MAAYVAYENGVPFTKQTIETILSGNICPNGSYIYIRKALLLLEEKRTTAQKYTWRCHLKIRRYFSTKALWEITSSPGPWNNY